GCLLGRRVVQWLSLCGYRCDGVTGWVKAVDGHRGSLVTNAKKDGGLYLMSRKEEEVMCAFFNRQY
ncbi:MAG: hypothetical protein ACRC4P_03480, partial [Aeromonas sp.]